MARYRSVAPAFGALAGILLLVTGCTTPSAPAVSPAAPSAFTGPDGTPSVSAPAARPTPPPEPEPIPVVVTKPVPAVAAKPASITGSEESSTMFDNFTAFVAAVDGRPVTAGRAGWDSALALPAGPRRLTVTFIRGAFTAQTDLRFHARSEAIYQLKFATDAQIFGKSSYCEFWIVETATGNNVVAPTRVPLTKYEAAK